MIGQERVAVSHESRTAGVTNPTGLSPLLPNTALVERRVLLAEKVRFAQLGVTYPHALGYLEALTLMPEVEVVALYDPNPAEAQALLPEALHDRPLYGDVATLLAQEHPEAALIVLPNDLTPEVIIQTAEAGVHVQAEKPCARTAAEFRPAAEAIRRAGVQFATGYTRRFSPVGLAIKDAVDQGLLGRLVSIEARWITTSVEARNPAHVLFDTERSGGGILHWLGCHWLDAMRWVTSAEVTGVAAVMATLSGQPIGVEDAASLSLRYSNGMIGSLHCAYVTDQATDQLFFGLRGTEGWVQWPRSGPEVEIRSTHPAWAAAPTRVMRFAADPMGGYGGGAGSVAIRRFIASFREGAQPEFTPDDALRVLQTLDAAHESSRSGRYIEVAAAR